MTDDSVLQHFNSQRRQYFPYVRVWGSLQGKRRLVAASPRFRPPWQMFGFFL